MNIAEQIDYAPLCELVAIQVWGDPNRSLSNNKELRWGTHGSRSLKRETGRWYDHESQQGGSTIELLQREYGHSFTEANAWLRKNNLLGSRSAENGRRHPLGNIEATYNYVDESGAPLFRVLRYPAHEFRQQRPDGRGGWLWGLIDKNTNAKTRRVLYRLPELIEALASEHIVLIVEGEKDVETLIGIGIPATTNAGGAGKWRNEYSETLRGADVVILPDNDDPGRDHAAQIAASLSGIAKRVRVLDIAQHWPGCPEKGDISDWIAAGGTADALWKLIEGITDRTLSEPASSPFDLSTIFTFVGDAPAAPPRELIKGLLPSEGVAVTGGQPSAGKTFIMIHKAICLATTRPYFGHKVVERVGTVFIAAEGRPLLPNRFAAATAKESITEKLPIVWIRQLPDFTSLDGIKLLVAQLKALDERFQGDFGVRLGNVAIDTIAACFNIKNEDDNAEATKTSNVLRSVGEQIGTLMAPVHHFGKNPESGLRGASAWKGSADIVEGVLADIDPLSGRASNRELVCSKARDGEQGPISAFDLEFIELGIDLDGEIYGSCCVVPTAGASRFNKTTAIPKGQRAILEAINEALDSHGKVITPRAGMVAVKAAKVNDVRQEFDRRYVVAEADPAKAANAKRMAFKRALDHLPPSKFGAGSAEEADWIWKI